MTIKLNKKTGFFNTGIEPIIIYDYRLKPFYDTRNIKKRVKKFNLPKGLYFVKSGRFEKMIKPVDYKLYDLPKLERRYKNPFNFNVVFADNPSKCSILWNRDLIVFDHKLRNLTLPEIHFILFHEFAHKLYSTEKYTDLLAANLMLLKGYNTYQIGSAPVTSLSCRQYERKKFLVNSLVQ